MTDRIYLFSNGTQFMDWDARNCSKCDRLTWDKDGNPVTSCKLYHAIADAACDDGSVTPEMAQRLGYTSGAYTWDCPERNGADREEWDRREREAIESGLIVPRTGEAGA